MLNTFKGTNIMQVYFCQFRYWHHSSYTYYFVLFSTARKNERGGNRYDVDRVESDLIVRRKILLSFQVHPQPKFIVSFDIMLQIEPIWFVMVLFQTLQQFKLIKFVFALNHHDTKIAEIKNDWKTNIPWWDAIATHF